MANLKTRLLAVWVAAVSVSSARLRCWSAMALLDGDFALPIGKPGERQRDNQAGRSCQ